MFYYEIISIMYIKSTHESLFNQSLIHTWAPKLEFIFILFYFQVPEVYTSVLERLLVIQIDTFPQYSQRMQYTTCRSIIKVLVAMAARGPVLWSFTASVGENQLQNAGFPRTDF